MKNFNKKNALITGITITALGVVLISVGAASCNKKLKDTTTTSVIEFTSAP